MLILRFCGVTKLGTGAFYYKHAISDIALNAEAKMWIW